MENKLSIEMVGVGHGDCFVLKWEPAIGKTSHVVIDGGPRRGGTKLGNALASLGASSVDLMVLSHSDADHVDGLLEYTRLPGRLPVTKYWGPCLPAFSRHNWLFGNRIQRGLRAAAELETELAEDTAISWPVEGASWRSQDGGLSIRVLSPAGRLIERLLVGDDAISLFLHQPMPVGWLFDPGSDPGPEDAYEDLRAAIRSGEIDPDRVPGGLPASTGTADREELAAEAARDFGIDPEFFGNGVLNDTSLVLLIEAALGGSAKRMLFTGDLETFDYLMTRHPTGLGCEVVKAPHHGSRSHLGTKAEAYDEVWQWLRPRAVLVSAGGKHGLPRSDFRNATLRSGATLFCACRRGKEILSGPHLETSCNTQFSCSKGDRSVTLELSKDAFSSDAQACGSSATGMQPVIHMVQHVVEPSAILERMATAERDKHVNWVTTLLRNRHSDRVAAGGEAGLEAVRLQDVEREARSAKRFRAAADIDLIVETAARDGKIWLSRADRYNRDQRRAWIMPSESQFADMLGWLETHSVIAFLIPERTIGRTPRELLMASDTVYLETQVAERFVFPEAMFTDAIWPRLSKDLIKKGWLISSRYFKTSKVTGVLCTRDDINETFRKLSIGLPALPSAEFLQLITRHTFGDSVPFPVDLERTMMPYTKDGRTTRIAEFEQALTDRCGEDYIEIFPGSRGIDRKDLAGIKPYGSLDWSAKAPAILAALLVGGY